MTQSFAALVAVVAIALAAPAAMAEEQPAAFVKFGEDFGATCVNRQTVTVTVRNTHPSRTVRVWLERSVGGVPTGDRSKSDLKPSAAPEDLGCAKSLEGAEQKWKVQRAVFLDG
ncbi:MAG: hypothetical protein JNL68_18765 [Burkholderiales bacterium]|nr:hypothetical protein [Burkholderiales bacterium]